MVDIEKLTEQFHEEHDVVYELRCVVDGEEVVKETSGISADDLSGLAWVIDDWVTNNLILTDDNRGDFSEASDED